MNARDIRSLKKIINGSNQMNRYINYKKIGYEPKCKICNSKYQNQIEAFKENDYTLEEMKEFLSGKGEKVSIMSLSRHFERHYPRRKAHLIGLDDETTKTLMEGEKVIKQDLKDDPNFEKVLEAEHTYYVFDNHGEYEKFTKKGREIYIFNQGYCITGEKFCELVPHLHKLRATEVIGNLKNKIFELNNGLVNDWMNEKKIQLLEDSLKCTNCQTFYNECISDGLLKLALNKWYGVEMEPEEFKKILFDEDFIYEGMDAEIKKYSVNEKYLEDP